MWSEPEPAYSLRPATELTCYLNITEMCFGIESNNASEASCVQHIFELPEGIAGKILT